MKFRRAAPQLQRPARDFDSDLLDHGVTMSPMRIQQF
jgi:hypothetical protein